MIQIIVLNYFGFIRSAFSYALSTLRQMRLMRSFLKPIVHACLQRANYTLSTKEQKKINFYYPLFNQIVNIENYLRLKGRKPSIIESPEQEVDEIFLFDIPEKAKIFPSRAQMQARAEAGYGGENPDLPGDNEEDLPTDLLGEDEVLPMGSGAYPFLQEETHDDFVKRMLEHIDGPVPIWDVRITTKQGYEWVCGDVNSSNMPPIPVHPTFVPYGQPGPNIPGLERMPCCVVLEQFIPMSMYARIAQETNAYRARCKENTRNMDLDEQDFYDSKDVTDEDVKFFERDYDLKWEDQSIGSILRYIGMHQGIALRPRKKHKRVLEQR